jgi:hypothetical protein
MDETARGLTERQRLAIWIGRVALILGYAGLTRWCAHNGDPLTEGEFSALVVVGANAIVIVLLAGWVAGGSWRD